jgi:hypothetical protein
MRGFNNNAVRILGVDAGRLPKILIETEFDEEVEDSVMTLLFDLFYWYPETSVNEANEYLHREGLLDPVGNPHSNGLLSSLIQEIATISTCDLNQNLKPISDTDKVLEYDKVRDGYVWFKY